MSKTNLTSGEVLVLLLNYDAEPPDEEYSPHEHGLQLREAFSCENAAELAGDCIRHLPGSLASSFLEGFLGSESDTTIATALLNSIPHAKETGSAGDAVSLLRNNFRMSRSAILTRICELLVASRTEAEQDRLSTAVRYLVSSRNLDTQAGNGENLSNADAEKIRSAISQSNLFERPGQLLVRCARAIEANP